MIYSGVKRTGKDFQNFFPSPAPSPMPTLAPAPPVSDINGLPERIRIPKVDIDAKIIEEGENDEGEMIVPPDAKTVGWWKYGKNPGEVGSAVFAGHFRVDSGKPGIFYNLNKLSLGDEILIANDKGQILTFVVTDIKMYPVNEFPLNSFFNTNDTRRLNLITCAGSYIKEIDNYSHRLAVYSVLKAVE